MKDDKFLITLNRKLLQSLSGEAQELFNEAIKYAASEIYSAETGTLVEAENINIDNYLLVDITVRANIN